LKLLTSSTNVCTGVVTEVDSDSSPVFGYENNGLSRRDETNEDEEDDEPVSVEMVSHQDSGVRRFLDSHPEYMSISRVVSYLIIIHLYMTPVFYSLLKQKCLVHFRVLWDVR